MNKNKIDFAPAGKTDSANDAGHGDIQNNVRDGIGLWSRVGWVRHVLPVIFLGLVAVLAGRELSSLDLHAVRAVLQGLTLSQLLLIQGVAVAGVLSMGLYDWRSARIFSIQLSLPTLIRNAWIANAFNNLVGMSGLAGSGIRLLLLGREQVEPSRAAAYSALIIATVPVGLAVMCWPLVASGIPGIEKLALPGWIAWLAIGMFALYLPLYLVILKKGLFAHLLRSLQPQSVASLLGLVGISVLDWLLAATVAWLALEFTGATVPWIIFLAAFVLASALGILSLIPGGLGVFDTALVVLLAPFAQSPEHLVSALLINRLCYYLVPWLIAVYMGANVLMLSEHWQRLALFRLWRDSRLSSLINLPLNVLASIGVRVLSYLTFAGGVVLLISAAFPGLSERLSMLARFMPHVAIEISHMLSVATGVLLIALSRGIAEQVRGAYYLTQMLLLGGAVFSILKGIDFEEAIILLFVAMLLKRQRHHFYRESYPLFSTRSLLWLVGLLGSIVGFAWLGDWVHGNVPLGWESLSRFAPHMETPRFARALLIAATVGTVFIGWSFIKRSTPLLNMPDARELEEVEVILNLYGGNELAHLVFLGDKYIFWSSDRKAFIQYGQIRDRLIVLGDPCGNPDSIDAIIIAFRDYADRYGLTPCFYEVNEHLLHNYHDAGFAMFKLGEYAMVKLEEFSLAGKRNDNLRHAVNRAKRAGASFEFLGTPISTSQWSELQVISDAWLKDRGIAEKRFSLGYYDEDYLARSQICVIKVGQRITAFANLMPDYGNHTVLSIDLMRHIPDAPYGTMDLLFAELMLYAQSQGYQYFNLGMAPLGGVGESRYARAGEKVARLAYEYGNRFYNYKGLRAFKEKFHPEWRSVYLAYPLLTPLPLLLFDSAALIAGGYRRIFFRSGELR